MVSTLKRDSLRSFLPTGQATVTSKKAQESFFRAAEGRPVRSRVPEIGGAASGGLHDPGGWGGEAQSGVGEAGGPTVDRVSWQLRAATFCRRLTWIGRPKRFTTSWHQELHF